MVNGLRCPKNAENSVKEIKVNMGALTNIVFLGSLTNLRERKILGFIIKHTL